MSTSNKNFTEKTSNQMELRSTVQRRNKKEFRDLQITLTGLGFYEAGMELHEMRQLVEALQASMSQNEPDSLLKHDMELAMRESELDFMPMYDVHNSTMISSFNNGLNAKTPQQLHKNSFYQRTTSSPFSSPEVPATKLTVQVDVHHACDWSPPQRATAPGLTVLDFKLLPRKRLTADLDSIVASPTAATTEGECNNATDIKRPRLELSSTSPCSSACSTTSAQGTIDSGVNMSQFSGSNTPAGAAARMQSSDVGQMQQDFVSYVYNVNNSLDDDDDHSEPSM